MFLYSVFHRPTTVKIGSSLLGKPAKCAYRITVEMLDVAIDLIEAHFMCHVVFLFIVSKVAY